jgi:hypothetical protein
MRSAFGTASLRPGTPRRRWWQPSTRR